MNSEHVEVFRDALRKAFRYGETHWQQADSEYASDHRKAGETMDKFRAWADETAAAIAALSAPQPPAEAQPVGQMTDNLLPCPWCRSQPNIQPWHGGGPEKHMVSCDEDECEAGPKVTGETRLEAIAAWNRRCPPPSSPVGVDGGEVEYEFEVWQDNSLQAGGSASDYATAKSDADHYALIYGQDGPVEVRMYVRRQITSPPSAPVGVSAEDRLVLMRLRDALPDVGLNGWIRGVEVINRILAQQPGGSDNDR